MDPFVTEQANILFRWLHVIAGVMWIGHLWFFNFVNSQVAKTYDADSKKKVVPELMPRALYFFRWGAAWTWITGLLLLGVVYYHPLVLLPADSSMGLGAGVGVSLALLAIGFVVYDLLWSSPLGKNETAAATVSVILMIGVAFGLSRFFTGRALFIHMGAMFGTMMAANVWMRIWPAQRKIIAAIKGTGPAPEPSVGAVAGLRSKHNTYMAVPLILFMISNHWATALGDSMNWLIIGAIIVVGFGLAKFFYIKAASAAPAWY